MKKIIVSGFILIIAAGLAFSSAAKEKDSIKYPEPAGAATKEAGTGMAVFAGGCFWGVEGVFEQLKGVTNVVSGYSGGEASTATYGQVGSGSTGHAESIEITYDSSVMNYETLLKVFFSVAHDPTELNYQGPDVGTQYRSAIFFMNDVQKQAAEKYIKLLDDAKVYPKKIVTEVTPYKAFYAAEDYHQNFMRNNPDYPYIVYWDLPKMERLKQEFPELLKK
ncbi:MAG: peptide-methionine (S)-S-oxide reductase MsrA [Spirochaetales bacterium]|nr:MAG: peptide-methionine (S)-S-oxide reductase MsrA [Spirochaetales bacterium]